MTRHFTSRRGERCISTILDVVVSLEDGPMEPDDPAEIAELVELAAAGQRQAWDALVRRFNGLIWAIVRRSTRAPMGYRSAW